jgi:TonB-dependent receptor
VQYAAVISTDAVATQNAGSMFFSSTNEKMKNIRYDISKQFKIKSTSHDIKIGGSHQYRDRDFSARLLGFTYYRKGSQILPNTNFSLLDEDHIFASENMGIVDGPGKNDGGFKLSESTTEKDSYKASSMLHAGYVMIDSRLSDKLRFIYGARLESYNQKLTSTLFNVTSTKDTTVVDLLPSVNVVYSITDQINLRLAYYKTVSRPEFRELASFNFYDFVTDFSISGNPNLTRAKIDNYDVRLEWYPGAGQMVSVSGFYKKINNAVEQAADVATQNRSLTFVNVARVDNIGAELEYRFKLSSLFNRDSSKLLSNITVFSNFSYIQSKVDVSHIIGAEPRPLQGQSPYIINAGVQYLDSETDWGVSASYNVIGRRIVIVGSTGEPSYWENPRHVIDLQLVKTIKKKIELKLNVRDLLAQNQILTRMRN